MNTPKSLDPRQDMARPLVATDTVEPARNPRGNPFLPVYAQGNSRSSREKYDTLPDFPQYIDIELTNLCNFRCLMCPTGTRSLTRDSGMMDPALFYSILDQVKERQTPLRFIRWGEPTLHPKLLEFLAAAKRHGIICHMNTNGSKMDDAMLQALVDLPLDSIKFSFQGVDQKSYREMRNTDFFDDLLKVARRLYDLRGTREFPYIQVSTTITYESRAQVKAFLDYVAPFTDRATVGMTMLSHIDMDKVFLGEEEKKMLEYLRSQERIVRKHPECPEVFEKLSINWDGTVTACCSDSDNKMLIGDLKRQSLAEIWKSDVLNQYRDLLVDMRHDEIEFCSGCWDNSSLRVPGLIPEASVSDESQS